MSIWFYSILIILSVFLVIAILNLHFIKKSIQEIRFSLKEILKSDTNQLLTVSSSNPEIKELADDLNRELKDLRKQKLQYENGNEELQKSITNLSHDMRTPLTAISGYLDLIKDKKSKQEEYLAIIERKTKDLITLTEQLFDYSKAMDTTAQIKKEKCCINEILEETLASYYPIFQENKIEPQVNMTQVKIYKWMDKNTMIRVLENIISNGIKYSEGDFKITLGPDGKITFSNRTTSFDRATVKKIFHRYYTVENAKKSTGIGLAIAKQLVELNGGKIEAKYENENLMIEIII